MFSQWNLIHKSYFVIFFLPLFLITGPFLSDLSISVCALLIFISFWKLKNINFFLKNYVIIFFLLFYFFVIINSFFSNGINEKTIKDIFYFRFIFFSIFLSLALEIKNFRTFFFYILLLTLIFVIIDTYIQFFFNKDILGYSQLCVRDCNFSDEIKTMRLTGPFGDKAIVGSYIVRLLPLILCLFFFHKKKTNTLLESVILLIIVLAFGIVFLTGERTSFILYIFFLISSLLFINFNFKKKLIIFFSSIIFVSCLAVSYPDAKFRMIDFTLIQIGLESKLILQKKTAKSEHISKTINDEIVKDFNFDGNKSQIKIFSHHHHNHYLTAYKMFLDKPIFGHGPRSFRKNCKFYTNSKYGCTTHPHNLILQFAAELGFVGLLFYLIGIIYLIKIIVFKANKQISSNCLICTCICIFINYFPLVPSGNYFNNWMSIFLYLPIGFLIYELRK